MANSLGLPAIFSRGMVIQRDVETSVWGWGLPGSRVDVSVEGVAGEDASASVTADAQGDFLVTLPPLSAGEGYSLHVVSGDDAVDVEDVAVGDLWLLGGQSNAQLPLRRLVSRFPKVIDEAKDGGLRVFRAPEAFSFHGPQRDLPGMAWTRIGVDDVSEVSGIAYFMGEGLRRRLDVPVGIIATGLGGTPIEAWMSERWLSRMGLLPRDYDALRNDDFVSQVIADDSERDDRYLHDLDALDQGLRQEWWRSDLEDSDWQTMSLTQAGRPDLRDPGVIWLRRTVRVPDGLVGRPGQLRFGTLQDADEIYVNGRLIGRTEYRYPPRNYDVGPLEPRMDITIRLKVFFGTGGFTEGKRHVIVAGDDVVDCDVDAGGRPAVWRYRRSVTFRRRQEQTFFQYLPAGPYNAVLAPWGRTRIRGMVWYQGESNTFQPYRYGEKLIGLIQCWRELFGDARLPFIVVQLPGFGLEPNHDWSRLRDEQRMALLLDDTALVTTADCGEDNDLHPTDKRTVADRIVAAAMSLAYGSDDEPMGPFAFEAHFDPENSKVYLPFSHTGKGLRLRDGANAVPMVLRSVHEEGDRTVIKPVPVSASIVGPDTMACALPSGMTPSDGSTLRYAWTDCPRLVIENSCGLPAPPFCVRIVM